MSAHPALVAALVILGTLSSVSAYGQKSDISMAETTGYLLVPSPGCGIETIRLPTLERKIVRLPMEQNSHDWPSLFSISGPDSEGRVAYVEDHQGREGKGDERYFLKTIMLDGTRDNVVFSRQADARCRAYGEGNAPIGHSLALSPKGGHIAFHTGITGVQMPGSMRPVGKLEIWTISSKRKIRFETESVESSLEWLPDGKRIAYVKFADPKEIVVPRHEVFRKKFLTWKKVPSVFIRDVDAGTESFVHVGDIFTISQDGRSILVGTREGTKPCHTFDNVESAPVVVKPTDKDSGMGPQDFDCSWVRVEIESGKSSSVTWRGSSGAIVLGRPAKDVLITATMVVKPRPKRRGLLSLFDPPMSVYPLSLVKLDSDNFNLLPLEEFDWRPSFGQGAIK